MAGRKAVVLLLLGMLFAASTSAAHDIPNDVVVQAFLKPQGDQLRLLLRVPMNAIRETELPRVGPGYLDLARADGPMREAALVWLARNIRLYEAGDPLGVPRISAVLASLPSDSSFLSFDSALAHVTGPPLSNDVQIFWEQAMLDVLLEYDIRSDQSRFAFESGFARLGLRVTTALRLVTPDGRERAFELHDDRGVVQLDPRWHQAAARFVAEGFRHILDGTDHLLFLFCLVIPLRHVRGLVGVVTAFTVAHSITLLASAYGVAPAGLWFGPLVETLIAASIVYMAVENIFVVAPRRRWIVAFAFGLVHGFGFSFALRDSLQFAGSHLLTALLSFNVGVELGQLLVLALVVPVLAGLFRYCVVERTGTIVLSAFVAHTGWHWLTERAERLRQFPVPAIDLTTLADTMPMLTLVAGAACMAWLTAVVFRRRRFRSA